MRHNTVSILYTHLPHYRQAVFNELSESKNYDFRFYYDPIGVDPTIKSGQIGKKDFFIKTFRIGPFLFQPGFLWHLIFERMDACILLGNPYILTNWLYALVAHCRGCKVLFWTHGWTRIERGAKGVLRTSFYRLADVLLLYGERARQIGIIEGFAENKLHVIYNSLDYDAQCFEREKNHFCETPFTPFFLCVSRLVREVELELAIKALELVNQRVDTPVCLVIVGQGPEKVHLAELAKMSGVRLVFKGAVYNEKQLAPLFMSTTAVVSPGKVGLLAMHALAYGAPVITHGDFNHQMPEVEAINEGLTGDFFLRGDVTSLSEVMLRWLAKSDRESVRIKAVQTIEENYTPVVQKSLIEAALKKLLER